MNLAKFLANYRLLEELIQDLANRYTVLEFLSQFVSYFKVNSKKEQIQELKEALLAEQKLNTLAEENQASQASEAAEVQSHLNAQIDLLQQQLAELQERCAQLTDEIEAGNQGMVANCDTSQQSLIVAIEEQKTQEHCISQASVFHISLLRRSSGGPQEDILRRSSGGPQEVLK